MAPPAGRHSKQVTYGSTEVEAETPDHAKITLKMDNLRLCSNGMFSNVYRGKIVNPNENDPQSIAVKKCWTKSDSSLTEARIFGRLHRHHHKNIVQLLYMFQSEHSGRTCYGLVFEFMHATLYTHIRELRKQTDRKPNIIEVKLLAWQLFRGQAHLAAQNIVHRDIKPQNILVNPETGLLKISDFGSSKFYHAGEPSHYYHVTRYYRAPELILQATQYGQEIDVWSCGCVLGEMLKCTVLWVGNTTAQQLHVIAETLGQPTTEDIKAMKIHDQKLLRSEEIKLSYKKAAVNFPPTFKKLLPSAPPEALALMKDVLVYNPFKRLCGPQFLKNPWFYELFDPATRRSNGKPITILSSADYHAAIAGDKVADDSKTGGSPTNDENDNDL